MSEFGDVYEIEFGPDRLPTTAVVKKEFQRKIIYNMSPLEVILPGLSFRFLISVLDLSGLKMKFLLNFAHHAYHLRFAFLRMV